MGGGYKSGQRKHLHNNGQKKKYINAYFQRRILWRQNLSSNFGYILFVSIDAKRPKITI